MSALGGVTADQWGLITTAQANRAGVDNETLARLVKAGLLDRVRWGVYAATAANEDPLRTQKAAWLLLRPSVPAWERPRLDPDSGVLSHRTAALMHGIGDLSADTIEFTVPRRRASRHSDLAFHVAKLPESDVTLVGGLPVTTVERTIVDLLADHIDGGHAGDIVDQALRRGLTELDVLAERVHPYAHRYRVKGGGTALLKSLLAQSGNSSALARFSVPQVQVSNIETSELLRVIRDATGPALTPQLTEQIQEIVRAGTSGIPAQINDIIAAGTRVEQLRESILRMAEQVAAAAAQVDKITRGDQSNQAD